MCVGKVYRQQYPPPCAIPCKEVYGNLIEKFCVQFLLLFSNILCQLFDTHIETTMPQQKTDEDDGNFTDLKSRERERFMTSGVVVI